MCATSRTGIRRTSCSQIELDEVVNKAVDRRKKMEAQAGIEGDGPGLRPAADADAASQAVDTDSGSDSEPNADDIFSNFKG